ncbi:stathmin-4-like [Corythoichthys intestinalis]|uniref:stathmin-4-like n=1 Tax=Corythoichthys intestinalis TaxID=161448 RepID=UPI0025A6393D|nr:stathmin-4-like [Corythoichthys intestinalis]
MTSSLREKLQGLPLASLLCSCIIQKAPDTSAEKEGTVDLKLGAIHHLEPGEHASGRAFRVVLEPPGFGGGPGQGTQDACRQIVCREAELLEPGREDRRCVVNDRLNSDVRNMTEVS